MISFWAIVKLTLKSALRSHIFQLLLALLVICAVALPITVSGGGEGARAYIQIALKYSLGAVSFILAMSSVWLSSLVMTQDVENYQLHMVVSKPVSKIRIFLAKFTGIVLLNTFLMILAGLVIYGEVMWRFSQDNFSEGERARIEDEVLVGRRIFYADPMDLERLAKEAAREQLEELKKTPGMRLNNNIADMEKDILNNISRDILAQRAEVLFGKYAEWTFSNLPTDKDAPIYLRYRCYVGKVDTQFQRNTTGLWTGYFVEKRVPTGDGGEAEQAIPVAAEEYTRTWMALTPQVEREYAGEFHEKQLPPSLITDDGTATLRYVNLDDGQDKIYFQSIDGPRIMMKVAGFTENYFRGLLVILLLIMVYTGITCAAASAFSMPTSIFVVLSYMFLGSVAPLIMTTNQLADVKAYFGYYLGKIIMMVVVPLQEFEVSQKVATGELVEFAYLGNLSLYYLILRALPIVLLGVWVYYRRELGLVIRK